MIATPGSNQVPIANHWMELRVHRYCDWAYWVCIVLHRNLISE